MSEWLLVNEPTVRLASALGVFGLMALWEVVAPARALRVGRGARWFANLGLVVLNTLLMRVLVPTAAVGVAVVAAERGWGLLNLIALPSWAAVVIAVVALDLGIWAQHVVFHRVPVLWRLHRVHHADVDYDVTLGTRFHPIEILLSMGIKVALVTLLGAPAAAVVLFEVILNGMALFNHGNVALPRPVEAVVRQVLVTPDFHRVHHSVVPRETHSNFGFNLSLWDRLFGTWRDEATGGRQGLTIGLPDLQGATRQGIPFLLALPFRDSKPPEDADRAAA